MCGGGLIKQGMKCKGESAGMMCVCGGGLIKQGMKCKGESTGMMCVCVGGDSLNRE